MKYFLKIGLVFLAALVSNSSSAQQLTSRNEARRFISQGIQAKKDLLTILKSTSVEEERLLAVVSLLAITQQKEDPEVNRALDQLAADQNKKGRGRFLAVTRELWQKDVGENLSPETLEAFEYSFLYFRGSLVFHFDLLGQKPLSRLKMLYETSSDQRRLVSLMIKTNYALDSDDIHKDIVEKKISSLTDFNSSEFGDVVGFIGDAASRISDQSWHKERMDTSIANMKSEGLSEAYLNHFSLFSMHFSLIKVDEFYPTDWIEELVTPYLTGEANESDDQWALRRTLLLSSAGILAKKLKPEAPLSIKFKAEKDAKSFATKAFESDIREFVSLYTEVLSEKRVLTVDLAKTLLSDQNLVARKSVLEALRLQENWTSGEQKGFIDLLQEWSLPSTTHPKTDVELAELAATLSSLSAQTINDACGQLQLYSGLSNADATTRTEIWDIIFEKGCTNDKFIASLRRSILNDPSLKVRLHILSYLKEAMITQDVKSLSPLYDNARLGKALIMLIGHKNTSLSDAATEVAEQYFRHSPHAEKLTMTILNNRLLNKRVKDFGKDQAEQLIAAGLTDNTYLLGQYLDATKDGSRYKPYRVIQMIETAEKMRKKLEERQWREDDSADNN